MKRIPLRFIIVLLGCDGLVTTASAQSLCLSPDSTIAKTALSWFQQTVTLKTKDGKAVRQSLQLPYIAQSDSVTLIQPNPAAKISMVLPDTLLPLVPADTTWPGQRAATLRASARRWIPTDTSVCTQAAFAFRKAWWINILSRANENADSVPPVPDSVWVIRIGSQRYVAFNSAFKMSDGRLFYSLFTNTWLYVKSFPQN